MPRPAWTLYAYQLIEPDDQLDLFACREVRVHVVARQLGWIPRRTARFAASCCRHSRAGSRWNGRVCATGCCVPIAGNNWRRKSAGSACPGWSEPSR